MEVQLMNETSLESRYITHTLLIAACHSATKNKETLSFSDLTFSAQNVQMFLCCDIPHASPVKGMAD